MRLVNMTCPNCGAQLQIDADRTQVYCKYCGTKLLMQDDVHHIHYDNAEETGYLFEKGRQRAMAEAENMRRQNASYQQQRYDYPPTQSRNRAQQQPRKGHFWLWLLGWIIIFPVPVTILMTRRKDIRPIIKYGVIIAAWIVYLALMTSSQ